MNLGRFDESLQESQKLLELDPVSTAANLHLGNHYMAARQWDLAIEQEKKTLKMDPDYVEAHRQLAEAYLGKKMYQEAETEMQRAADLLGPKRDYPRSTRHCCGTSWDRRETYRVHRRCFQRSSHPISHCWKATSTQVSEIEREASKC